MIPPATATSTSEKPYLDTDNAPQQKTLFFYEKTDDYFEFSNFYPRSVIINNIVWPTTEHYYQAQKFQRDEDKEKIRQASTPEEAFYLGQHLDSPRITQWDAIKIAIMRQALREKFTQHDDLKQLLLDTDTAIIQEKSSTDSFWGIGHDHQGKNRMGLLLMELREDLKQSEKTTSAQHNKTAIPYTAEDNILQQSQVEQFPYYITIAGRNYIVLQKVFSPKYFPDVEMFVNNLPIAQDISFLEIGTGIGFAAISVAYRGAKHVVATDINPWAVDNARQNVRLHRMQNKIDVRQGSVFAPIQKDEKFDVIYWNVPFQFVAEDLPRTILQQATCDAGYKFIENYIANGADYLNEHGRLFLGFSTSIGRMDKLNTILHNLNVRLHCTAKKTVIRSQLPISFELFEILY